MPERSHRPLVVVFDWNIVRTSPAGSVVREQLAGLADDYDFVVIADRFDNPVPDRIAFVRVPLPPGPSFLKDTLYPYIASAAFRTWRRGSRAPDLVQTTQGQYASPDIAYAHSCHQTYLQKYWHRGQTRGVRRVTARLVHEHNARRERRAFTRAQVVVAPSAGLMRDLSESYPQIEKKLRLIPNPVAVGDFRRPEAFDVLSARAELGLDADDVVFVLVALGNFGHKGLDVALDALSRITDKRAKLLVVGGSKGGLARFREHARALGIESQVLFTGFVDDVRRFLWSSDVFVFPSLYEGFPLAALQAAAAGLPLIATRVNGIEEILREGETGWSVSRTPESVAAAFDRVLGQPRAVVSALGAAAAEAVGRFDVPSFVDLWQSCYREVFERADVHTHASR